VFLAPRPVLLLDEPTAHLDAVTEQRVLVALQGLRGPGRLIVLVAHRPTLVAIADDVVPVEARVTTGHDALASDALLTTGSAP
jgi:ATP-binding cassette subfamily C protein CydD